MRILIASDGSKWAQKSVRFALQLFGETGHELTVLIFKQRPQDMEPTSEAITRGTLEKGDNIGAGEAPRTIERKVQDLIDDLEVDPDNLIWLREEGDMAAHLLELAPDYDLVCVGGAGKGGFSQKMLGLIADQVVKKGKGNLMVTKTSDAVCGDVLVALTSACVSEDLAHYLGHMFQGTPATVRLDVLWEELPGRFEGYMEATTRQRMKRMVDDALVEEPDQLDRIVEIVESYGVDCSFSYQDYKSLNQLIDDVEPTSFDLVIVHPPPVETGLLSMLEPGKKSLDLMRKSSANVMLLRSVPDWEE